MPVPSCSTFLPGLELSLQVGASIAGRKGRLFLSLEGGYNPDMIASESQA